MKLGLVPSTTVPAGLTLDGNFRERIVITLYGAAPSKKNALRPTFGRRGYVYDAQTKAALESLVDQARIQWGTRRRAVTSPRIQFKAFTLNRKQDRDGMLTTALDVMKKAGILHDDCIEFCNGEIVIEPATIVLHDRERRLEISIDFPEGEATK